MKSNLLIVSVLVVLASCTSVYKTGQTPDDVYYSPERPQQQYAQTERRQRPQEEYVDMDTYRDDRYLRMRRLDRRWNDLYDDYYTYNPYNYHYINSSLYFNSPWSNYSYWNYYYNPYSYNYPVHYAVRPVSRNKPRMLDMTVYNTSSSSNSKGPRSSYVNSTQYGAQAPSANRVNTNYRGSRTNAGDYLRDTYQSRSGNNSSSNNNSGNNGSTRSTSSSSSSSSSSNSSSKPTTAPSRKF